MKLIDIYKKYLIEFQKNNVSDLSLKLLLCDIYNISSLSDFILNYDKDFEDLTRRQKRRIKRVLNGYPVQYEIGKTYFYNMELFVNKSVLIPRNETEELVYNTIIKMNKLFSINEELSLLDLGCGSGNIFLSIEKNTSFTYKKIVAIDKSLRALLVAKKNIKKYSSAAILRRNDMINYVLNTKNKFDILVCNPPYISKKYEVDSNVLNNEPSLALFSEPSYIYYEKIIESIPIIMNQKFIVAFEIGYDQKEIVDNILKKQSFYDKIEYNFIKDIYGKDRILLINSII